MSQLIVRSAALILAVVISVAPAVAHHAFATEFDASKPATVKGFVTRIQWTNPHTWIYINVPDATGKLVPWSFEMGSPTALYNNGWTRDSLAVGEEVEVEGSLARDGSNRLNARDVLIVRTGQLFGAASSEQDAQ